MFSYRKTKISVVESTTNILNKGRGRSSANYVALLK